MKIGRVEILLIILVVSAAAYMAVHYFPGGRSNPVCAPVALSHDVRNYIDQKFAASTGKVQCGDLISRVNELESKLGTLDKYKELRDSLTSKRESLEDVIEEQRLVQTDILAQFRSHELTRLRNEMAMLCSGISIRSSGIKPSDNTAGARGRRGGGGGGGGRRRGQLGAQPGDASGAVPNAGGKPDEGPGGGDD